MPKLAVLPVARAAGGAAPARVVGEEQLADDLEHSPPTYGTCTE